jgi:RNA polymerase sigma factor (sigma-70 family)
MPGHCSSATGTSSDRPVPHPLNVAELYTEQFSKLKRTLHARYGYLGSAEIEDLAQEAFYRFIRYLDKGGHIQKEVPYLFTTANHLAMRYVNRKNRELVTDVVPDVTDYAAMADTHAVEGQALVQQRLQNLPRAQRDTLVLIYLDFSPDEISVILGVSPTTVRSNLRHARKVLKERTATSIEDN